MNGFRPPVYYGVHDHIMDDPDKLLKFAEEGDADAQYLLGMYLDEKMKRYRESAKWYMRAAELGHKEAKSALALYYMEGIGVDRDVEKALKLFEDCYYHREGRAMWTAGRLYEEGTVVPQSYETAAMWYRRGEELDHWLSCYKLGMFYSEGKGVQKDLAEAIRLLRKAAELGAPEARIKLEAILRLADMADPPEEN